MEQDPGQRLRLINQTLWLPNVQRQQRGLEMPEAPSIPGGDNPLMMIADGQQQRLLERLRQADDEPVAFTELHAGGIAFPAAVISELELHGYVIDRVYDHGRLIGVRLVHAEPPDTPALDRRRRWPHR